MTGGTKLQGLLVVVGAMVVGVAGGVMLERTISNTPERPSWFDGRRPPRDSFGPGRRGSLPRGFDDLQLTQVQRERIDSIFQAWRPKTQAAMNEVFPRIEALRDSVQMEIDAVLTPEQRELLRERMPQTGRNWRNGLDGRRPDGPRRRPLPGN